MAHTSTIYSQNSHARTTTLSRGRMALLTDSPLCQGKESYAIIVSGGWTLTILLWLTWDSLMRPSDPLKGRMVKFHLLYFLSSLFIEQLHECGISSFHRPVTCDLFLWILLKRHYLVTKSKTEQNSCKGRKLRLCVYNVAFWYLANWSMQHTNTTRNYDNLTWIYFVCKITDI